MNKSFKFKVGLFIIISVTVIICALFYIAFKKDLFADMRTYKLSSISGDGLTQGMPVVFSGFQIGKVFELELEDSGLVIITVKIPFKHDKWIRKDSKWTLEKPFIGSPRIVVTTENLNSKPLDDKTVVKINTIDDINEVIKKAQPLLEKVSTIAANVESMTGPKSDLEKTLANTQKITKLLSEKKNFLEMATGDPQSVAALNKAIQKVPEIMEDVNTIIKHVDELVGKTDEAVLGKEGSIQTVNSILRNFEAKLLKLDTTLENIAKITGDFAGSSNDLLLLRKEIDETVSSTNELIRDIKKLLPEEKKDIKLP